MICLKCVGKIVGIGSRVNMKLYCSVCQCIGHLPADVAKREPVKCQELDPPLAPNRCNICKATRISGPDIGGLLSEALNTREQLKQRIRRAAVGRPSHDRCDGAVRLKRPREYLVVDIHSPDQARIRHRYIV